MSHPCQSCRCWCSDQSGPALCSLWWVTPAGGAATVVPANVLYFTNDLPGSPFLFNVSAGYAVAAQVGVGFASSATPSSSPSVGASHTASVSASATVSPSPSVNSALALPPLTYTPQGSIAFGQGLVSGYAGETLSFTIVSRCVVVHGFYFVFRFVSTIRCCAPQGQVWQ